MHPDVSQAEPLDIEIVSVEHWPEYIIGFPAHVAITVRGRAGVTLGQLAFADLAGLNEAIGLEAVDTTSGAAFKYVPRPMVDRSMGRSPRRLEAGEQRRMLTDVSPLLLAVPHEGTFSLRFSFVSPQLTASAAPVTVRLRRSTPVEDALRQRVAPDRPTFPNWASWATACPADTIPDEAMLPSRHPLLFDLLLRQLYCGPTPLRTFDPRRLDVLTDPYAPERDALKAELYYLRGERTQYERIRDTVLKTTPGMAWWFRLIDTAGGAYVKSFSMRPQ